MTISEWTVDVAQAEEAITGESPLWDDARDILWWIDIQGMRLLGFNPQSGPVAPLHLPSEPGLVALAEDGSLIIGLEDGLWRLLPETGRLDLLTAVPAQHPNIRLNDGKPDRQGRLWFGSMDKSGSGAPHGALYCRHPGGRLETVRQGVRIPNAIVVSRDGGTLYFTDSPSQQVLAFDLDQSSGTLGNERIFRTFTGPDKPDGACIDDEDGLWIAVVHGARLDHLNASGELIESVPVPVAKPTMGIFGGHALSDLFITSQRRFLTPDQLTQQPLAGALLRVATSSRGATPNRMRIKPQVRGLKEAHWLKNHASEAENGHLLPSITTPQRSPPPPDMPPPVPPTPTSAASAPLGAATAVRP